MASSPLIISVQARCNSAFEDFVRTGSQQALAFLLKRERTEKKDQPKIRTQPATLVETLDRKAHDLVRTSDINTYPFLFRVSVGAAIFSEEAGYLLNAGFSYDRAGKIAQHLYKAARDPDEKRQWSLCKLATRNQAGDLFAKLTHYHDSGYAYLFAAEAAGELSDSALADTLGKKGVQQFMFAGKRPQNRFLTKMYDFYLNKLFQQKHPEQCL